ncbi:hypothetical protein [Antrihabitans cavernicola]|uniref:Uncharacterized protein n=1 Tax=Antrihabitans cavernicola TaxID=2495913 RepID=A0A5A7SFD4_9NOCA|nr:hypothetical protein [Spelaeibacter cavernicola]KAA0024149.1 hypothetical protein FOY51_06255 [Spelaeibacter cavernicola]
MKPNVRLSVKIDKLFDTFHPVGEPEQSPHVVAQVVSAALGADIPAQMIEDLRHGRYEDPVDPTVLIAIAEHFQVPGYYLTSDGELADSVAEQLEFLADLRHLGVNALDYRGVRLDRQQVRAILANLTRSDNPGS